MTLRPFWTIALNWTDISIRALLMTFTRPVARPHVYISHVGGLGRYDWVMLRDTAPSLPDNQMTLGHYFGPATDNGSALARPTVLPIFVCALSLMPP